MPTRFYFDDSLTSPLNSLAFDAAWEQTGEADRRFSPRKGSQFVLSALANQAAQTVPITTTQQILSRQYCTEPIPYATRIASRISIVLRVLESATSANVFLAWVLRLVSIDGSVVRATLGSSLTNAGTEYTTAAQTRIFTLTSLSGTPVTSQPGDRLVLEIGGHAQAPTAAQTYTHRYGTGGTSDFALTSGLTTDLNPWWELEQDLWPILPTSRQVIRAGDGVSIGPDNFR